MKKTSFLRCLSVILCIVLIAAMALVTTGCSDSKNEPVTSTEGTSHSFTFKVVDTKGNETSFDITTDKKTVGDALLEQGLIDGEDGAYGLYVKTVNGITLDYDKDGKYWAFYIDGEYAMSGVDKTDIKDGAVYSFKAE